MQTTQLKKKEEIKEKGSDEKVIDLTTIRSRGLD